MKNRYLWATIGVALGLAGCVSATTDTGSASTGALILPTYDVATPAGTDRVMLTAAVSGMLERQGPCVRLVGELDPVVIVWPRGTMLVGRTIRASDNSVIATLGQKTSLSGARLAADARSTVALGDASQCTDPLFLANPR